MDTVGAIFAMNYKSACKITLFLMFLLGISSQNVYAQLLDYGAYSGYALGRGIIGDDFSQPLPNCITGNSATTSASKADIRVSIVNTDDQYSQAFHIDQKAEASYLDVGSAAEELHLSQQTKRSSSAFDIVIEAYSEKDADTIGNIKWDSPYDKMMTSGDPGKIEQVRATCGDRFIQTVFYEARIFAILHVSSEKNSKLTSYSGKASGKMSIDVVSASAELGGD